jgi:hypothetical protein
MPAPLDTSGGKSTVQGVGSTNSYLRRYIACNIFNIGLERRKAGSIAYEGFERDGDPTVIERKLVDGSLKQVASSCPRGAPGTRG